LPDQGRIPDTPPFGDPAQLLGQFWLKPNCHLRSKTRLVLWGGRRGVILPSAVVGRVLRDLSDKSLVIAPIHRSRTFPLLATHLIAHPVTARKTPSRSSAQMTNT
jgi:hypothetical protein